MQVNSSPAQNQRQGRDWIRTQTCELPWRSAELHRRASLLPTDSQNCADVRCGHRICVSQEEGRESGTAPLAWRHSAATHFCPPSPSLGVMDAHAELEVPLDPGKLDAEQFHGGQLSWEPSPPTVNSAPARNQHVPSSVTGYSRLFLTTAVCGLS